MTDIEVRCLFAMQKSASRAVAAALTAMGGADDPFPLVAPPAYLDDPGFLVNQELSPNWMQEAGPGILHSHAPARSANAAVLERLRLPYLLLLRHPADHLAALYCHLRGLLVQRGEASSIPRPLGRTLARLEANWHDVVAPVAKEMFEDGASVEAAIEHLICDGYLVGVLKWAADWLRPASDYRMVLTYEQIMREPTVLGSAYRHLRGREPAHPVTLAEPDNAEPDPRIYPLGYTAPIGIWRDYFSRRNRQLYSDVVRRFQRLYAPAGALSMYYPLERLA